MDDAGVVINEIFDYFGEFKRGIAVSDDGPYETDTFEFCGINLNVSISIHGSVLVVRMHEWPIMERMRMDLSDPDFDLARARLRVAEVAIKLRAKYDEWHFHEQQDTLDVYYKQRDAR